MIYADEDYVSVGGKTSIKVGNKKVYIENNYKNYIKKSFIISNK